MNWRVRPSNAPVCPVIIVPLPRALRQEVPLGASGCTRLAVPWRDIHHAVHAACRCAGRMAGADRRPPRVTVDAAVRDRVRLARGVRRTRNWPSWHAARDWPRVLRDRRLQLHGVRAAVRHRPPRCYAHDLRGMDAGVSDGVRRGRVPARALFSRRNVGIDCLHAIRKSCVDAGGRVRRDLRNHVPRCVVRFDD